MGWLLVIAFLAALAATIIGMGPLGFLLAVGSMFVYGGIQALVEVLFRSLRNRSMARPEAARSTEGRVSGRALLTTGAPPSARSRRLIVLRLGQRFTDRLRPEIRENHT
jgi:hypothetical protein